MRLWGLIIFFSLAFGQKYTVQEGDSLYSIASRFKLTVADLERFNNLSGDTIQPGQVLKLNSPQQRPLPKPAISSVQGWASWYGGKFHGRRTASGERYNQHGFTAAHRRLAFGTRVRVTNLRNGRSVIVRINDRGPYTRGRIIDLSSAAARQIGMKGRGTAKVRLEVLR
jgi:rare lipoprotein A